MNYCYRRIVLIFFSFFSFITISFAQDLFLNRAPIHFIPYQKVEPTQTVGGYPILNLGSDLWLVNLKTYYASGSDAGTPMGIVSMVSAKENVLLATLYIQANLGLSSRAIDWTDEPCKDDSFLWKKSIGGKFSNINCVTISYITNFSPDLPTVVHVQFTRFYTLARRLSYTVNINPEVLGVDRDDEKAWEKSSWHKNVVENDPKKVAFLEHLEKWAEDVQNKIDDAFSQKLDAFANIPPLMSYF